MDDNQLYQDVEDEILALLEETIVNEIEAMKSHYTVSEIAREVLLASREKEF